MAADKAENAQGGNAIIVLDGDPDQRERIEGMAADLGVEVWAATPEDLVPERIDMWESLAQARAVVVSAQFGPRSGFEILESLTWGEGPPPRVTALSLDRPERVWIEAAFRAGATTCVLRPLDPEELKVKVVEASALPGNAEGDGDDESDPTEPGGTSEAAADAGGEEA